jgi:TolB protein
MSIRYKVSVAVLIVLIMIVGCGKAEPTATPIPPTATLAPPTSTPIPPTATLAPPTPMPTQTPVSPTNTPVPPTETATSAPTETVTPLPTDTPVPSPTHTGSGGGVIAYCYQPLTGSSLHQIYAINLDGSDNRRLIEAPVGLNHHDWSPDGQKIAAVGYATPSTWSIYVFDVDGGDLTRLTNTPGVWDSEPAWSPDGTRIAFTRIYPDQDDRQEVWVMNADGSEQRWIGVEGFAAKWAPDGSRFIYTSNRSGNYEIYTAKIDGTDEQQVTSTSANESFPTWSPDGGQIAYCASTGEWNTVENTDTYELYVMDADGTHVRQLTDNAAYDGNPRWSPDGAPGGGFIVFSSDRAETGHWEVYVMNADGSNVRRVTNTPSNATAINPVWRPKANAPVSPTQTSTPIQGAISADTVGQVELLSTLNEHHDKVFTLDFSRDGAYLASHSGDKEIKIWDVRSGQLAHTSSTSGVLFNNIDFSPVGYLLASDDVIWDVQSWQVVQAPGQSEGAVAFSHDGSLLAIAPGGRPIVLWDVTREQTVRTFDDPIENLFRSLAFSPDGALLAAGSNNNIIRLWDVANGSLAHTIQHDTGGEPLDHILDLAFSPDGRVFASGGTDCLVRLWDVQSWQVMHELNAGCAPTGLAFSPDGAILASSGPRLRLWDVQSGKLLHTLPHRDVIAVAFSPDGTLLASGGYDQKIYLWGMPR